MRVNNSHAFFCILEGDYGTPEYLPPLSMNLHVCNHIEREYDRVKGCYLAL